MITYEQLCATIRAHIKEIKVQDLYQKLENKARIIDIREPEEFNISHIQQAVNIPRGILEGEIDKHPDVAGYDNALQRLAEEPLYLICRSGKRSALATKSLEEMGFKKVYSLAGGMQAWLEAKLPYVTEKSY
jgi:rhodanese-related sulfurtransferase